MREQDFTRLQNGLSGSREVNPRSRIRKVCFEAAAFDLLLDGHVLPNWTIGGIITIIIPDTKYVGNFIESDAQD